jgi:hypothetical protein
VFSKGATAHKTLALWAVFMDNRFVLQSSLLRRLLDAVRR